MLAIGLALAAAASWGLADFLGGMASKRISVPLVLFVLEGAGLVVVLTVALASGEPFFEDWGDAAQAMGGGLAGVTALGCFYRALAIGTMSVVAPISAAGVTLPVVVGLATGDRPSALATAGLATVVVGVVLAAREESAREASRASIGLALLAAVGFGAFFALTDPAADASLIWTLVLVRGIAMPFVGAVVLLRRPSLPGRRDLLGLCGIGMIDLTATTLIAVANREGDLSVVSVLGSMYPVVTVLLAYLVLKERLARGQLAGVMLALAGVVLVATG